MNWQQPDWPDFRWDSGAMAALESRFLQQSGVLIGSVKHLADGDRAAITIDIITGEALKTSEIEGELLNRDSVQSSLRRQFGLETSPRHIPPAERGIAEMMVALCRDFAEPLTDKALYGWHNMVVNGRQDIRAIGRYRDHDDPMRVVSVPCTDPKCILKRRRQSPWRTRWRASSRGSRIRLRVASNPLPR
jgi:Fic family protein